MKKIKISTIILITILVIYSIISFYKLGNTKNPQTFAEVNEGEQIKFQIESDKVIEYAMIYSANNESNFSVFYSDDESFEDYIYDSYFEIEYDHVFQWNQVYINNSGIQSKYIMLQSNMSPSTLGEIKFFDIEKNEVEVSPIDENAKLLLDEQSYIPENYTYLNSSYFDEIYFPRASYEILHNKAIFEYVHPPLGKLINSIPIYFFGLTPFSYRLCGNIAGILMILIIYLIAKEIFSRERYALFAALIMALDGMHFVQTRIGTVDSQLVLFSLISFLFFIKFIKIPALEDIKKKIKPLIFSGIFFGLAVSVKWTAMFVGLGMAIIYFTKFILNKKFDYKLILWSILSYIIIPLFIYIACYIPIINNPNSEIYYQHLDKNGNEVEEYVHINDIKSFIKYQRAMYEYHSELVDTHPYSSPWYTWPIMKRPLWFYISRFDDGKVGTIACMGNPAIWWLTIPTAIFTLVHTIITIIRNMKNKKYQISKSGAIIITMIATTWLSYYFIGRIMFIYHYFITIPFMMLTIVYTINVLAKWKIKIDYIMPVLSLIFLGFFIYFYPIYSGKPVSIEYIQRTEWLRSWDYDGLPK